jgi:hypothetical protein
MIDPLTRERSQRRLYTTTRDSRKLLMFRLAGHEGRFTMCRSLPLLYLHILFLCLCPSIAGCGSSEHPIQFPVSFEIAEGNHLFVMGRHFVGPVTLTWEPGDSVRVEGMAIHPVPEGPPREISEEELERIYGTVPFIVDLVESGATWKEAARSYNELRTGIEMDAIRRYGRVLWSSGSEEVATKSVVDSLDTSLFDPDFEITWSPGYVVVKWDGMWYQAEFRLHQEAKFPGARKRVREPISEDDASAFTRSIMHRLGGDLGGVRMEVFSTGHVTLSGAAVGKALNQIEQSDHGKLVEGPLFDPDLELILEMKGGGDEAP